MEAAAFFVLLALVLLRAGLILLGAALILRPVSACPACFRDTFLLRRRILATLAPWVEWRWCPHCGWQGPSKREDPRPVQARIRILPARSSRQGREAA